MGKKAFVFSGQSNGVSSNLAAVGGDMKINKRVFIWVTGKGWQVATPGKLPFAPYSPVRNNSFWQFCKKVQEVENDDVYMVLEGEAGQPISEWDSPNGVQWKKLSASAMAALRSAQLSGKKYFDAMFWFQGEADANNASYKTDFSALRQHCITTGFISSETPIIAMEIANDAALSKAAMMELYEDPTKPWFNYVSNHGLTLGEDGIHFTGASHEIIGRERFYAAYLQTPRKIDGFYPGWTPNNFP